MWWKPIDFRIVIIEWRRTRNQYPNAKKQRKRQISLKIELIFRLKWKHFFWDKKKICIISNTIGQYFMLFEFNVMISAYIFFKWIQSKSDHYIVHLIWISNEKSEWNEIDNKADETSIWKKKPREIVHKMNENWWIWPQKVNSKCCDNQYLKGTDKRSQMVCECILCIISWKDINMHWLVCVCFSVAMKLCWVLELSIISFQRTWWLVWSNLHIKYDFHCAFNEPAIWNKKWRIIAKWKFNGQNSS